MPAPQLDHYIGRRIKSVESDDERTIVTLEGDIQITEYTPEALPEQAVGGLLTLYTQSASKSMFYVGNANNPRIYVFTLTPLTYTISDPRFDDGDVFNPQLDEDPRKVRELPDEPTDRIWDGPSEEE